MIKRVFAVGVAAALGLASLLSVPAIVSAKGFGLHRSHFGPSFSQNRLCSIIATASGIDDPTIFSRATAMSCLTSLSSRTSMGCHRYG
ncbi:MAG TPA: hypothetical protein VFC32_12245 [Pseudolabrys sp.]|nr:hypothetical protein [Pseudolabrys sp.]